MPSLMRPSSDGHALFWRADPAGHWTWSCTEWTAFTGLSEADSRGDGWLEAVHPADRVHAAAPWVVGGGSGVDRSPFRLRRSGGDGYSPVLPRAAYASGSDGCPCEWVGTLLVGTAEPPVHQGRVDDVQHHMRNALALIRSVARRTARTSDTAEHYASHFEGRLDAFARVQDARIRSPDDGVDLEGLIREELVAHRVGDVSLVVEGPLLRLKGGAAEAFALAVHELAVNSVKFGALTAAEGAVAVVWSVDRRTVPPTLLFRWSETGVTVATPAPRRRGFGSELIERSMPYELNAVTRLDFLPGEVRCTVAIPLTDEMAIPGPD